VPLVKFTLARPNGDVRVLRIDFGRAMTEADAFSFLQQLADAWSATLAAGQRDPWYGNLYVDIRWAGVRTLTPQSGGIVLSSKMTSTDSVAVAPELLSALRWSPLTDVFVEGVVRAAGVLDTPRPSAAYRLAPDALRRGTTLPPSRSWSR
jgi:hypothetical protein